MQCIDWAALKRVVVMRLDNIGDVIMTGPVLRALRAVNPQLHLTLLTSPAGSAAVPLLPWIDTSIASTVTWQDAFDELTLSPAREEALVAILRQGSFDAAIILTSFGQSPFPPAYACYLAGIPLRIGQSKEFGGSILSHPVKPPPDDCHQVHRNIHLLEQLGLPVADPNLELRIPSTLQSEAPSVLAEQGLCAGDYIALVPGASCQARRYDSRRFMAVAQILRMRLKARLIILGTPQEREIGCLASELEGEGIVNLVGQTSFPLFAYLVKHSAFVLANNSAAMHVADAFSVPMVVLFAGTDLESQWMPRRSKARLLRRETACAPCYRFQCPFDHECLGFPPAEIADRCLGLLCDAAPQLLRPLDSGAPYGERAWNA